MKYGALFDFVKGVIRIVEDKGQVCEVCGEIIPKRAIFCPMCGARIADKQTMDVNPAVVDMVEQFKKRSDEHPEDAAAHYNLALALIMLQRWGAAVQALERVRQLEPSFLDAHFQLVRAYIALGNLDAAKAVVSEMGQMAPNDDRTKRAAKLLRRALSKPSGT